MLQEGPLRELYTYGLLAEAECCSVLEFLKVRGVIDDSEFHRILRLNKRDRNAADQAQLMERTPWTVASDQIYQIMTAQHMDHEFIARLIYGDLNNQRRAKINSVRLSILDEARYSLQAPFGLIALLVCRNQEEFSSVMAAKRKELQLEFSRRPERAQDIEQAIEYKLWGLDFSKLDRKESESWREIIKTRISEISCKPLSRFNSGITNSPAKVATFLLQGFSNAPFGVRTGFSVPRLKNLAQGRITFMPLEDFNRLIRNSGFKTSPFSTLAWQLSHNLAVGSGKSPLGAMQIRIFNGLLFNSGLSQTELLRYCCDRALSDKAARTLLSVKDPKVPDVHSERFREVLTASGVMDSDPVVASNITSLLSLKSYPQAIVQWALSGFNGVSDEQRSELRYFFSLDTKGEVKDLLNWNRNFEESLKFRRSLSSGFDEDDPLFRRADLFSRSLGFIMGNFPGVSLDEVSLAVASYKGAVNFLFKMPNGSVAVPSSKDLRLLAPDPKNAVHVNRRDGRLQLCSKQLIDLLGDVRTEKGLSGLDSLAPFSSLFAEQLLNQTAKGEAALEYFVTTLVPGIAKHIYLSDDARKSLTSTLNFLRVVKHKGRFTYTHFGDVLQSVSDVSTRLLASQLSKGMLGQIDKLLCLATEIRNAPGNL